MAIPCSDAFVFFGATGDLAYKKIFPALQAMIRRGGLDMSIIGMARAGWTLDTLRERARDSLENNGGVDAEAFAKLSAQLRYVDGDYADPATYQRLMQALGAYGFLGRERGKPHFLAHIPAALDRLIDITDRLDTLPELNALARRCRVKAPW